MPLLSALRSGFNKLMLLSGRKKLAVGAVLVLSVGAGMGIYYLSKNSQVLSINETNSQLIYYTYDNIQLTVVVPNGLYTPSALAAAMAKALNAAAGSAAWAVKFSMGKFKFVNSKDTYVWVGEKLYDAAAGKTIYSTIKLTRLEDGQNQIPEWIKPGTPVYSETL